MNILMHYRLFDCCVNSRYQRFCDLSGEKCVLVWSRHRDTIILLIKFWRNDLFDYLIEGGLSKAGIWMWGLQSCCQLWMTRQHSIDNEDSGLSLEALTTPRISQELSSFGAVLNFNWQESCWNSRGDQNVFRQISGRAPSNFTYQTFVSIHSDNCGRMPATVHRISSYVKTSLQLKKRDLPPTSERASSEPAKALSTLGYDLNH
jgi:hypothetical protein